MKISEIEAGKTYSNSIHPGCGLTRHVVYEGTWTGFRDPLRVQYTYIDGPSKGKRGSCGKAKFAYWAAREVQE